MRPIGADTPIATVGSQATGPDLYQSVWLGGALEEHLDAVAKAGTAFLLPHRPAWRREAHGDDVGSGALELVREVAAERAVDVDDRLADRLANIRRLICP